MVLAYWRAVSRCSVQAVVEFQVRQPWVGAAAAVAAWPIWPAAKVVAVKSTWMSGSANRQWPILAARTAGAVADAGIASPFARALRLLWGRPFTTQCCPNPGGGGCDGGGPLYVGDTGQAMNAWRGCNCGGHHSAMSPATPQPIPLDAVGESIEYLDSAVPLNTSPGVPQPPAASSANPTPAPNLPNSAKRLNPARRSVSTASSERQSAR